MKTKNTHWTKEHDAILLKFYEPKGAKYCAELLGVALNAVYKRVTRIGLRVQDKRSWSEYEDSVLMAKHSTHTADEIGKELDRVKQSVRARADYLGVKCMLKHEKYKPLPVHSTRNKNDPRIDTPTGYIFRGTDHVHTQAALRPDNRTGRKASLEY